MSDLDTEWLEALEIEPTGDDAGAGDNTNNEEENDETQEDKNDSHDENKGSEEDDGSGKPDGGQDGKPGDGEGGKPADEAKEGDEAAAEATPALDPKTAVKEAIQEIQTSQQERYNTYEGLKKEVAETLYPEGIDRQLRDSDGDPIRGIDDLTGLINPKTGDYFTEEEAGAWLLSAQQKLNQDVATVEKFIEDVAETNLLLTEGAQRVAQKYAPILSQDAALKTRLLEAYNKTLVKDPKSGVALRAPVDVEEFFDIALEPLVAAKAAEAEAAKAAKAAADKKAKASQGERGDLKPSGKSERYSETDKEWAQAIKDYEEGV